MKRIILFLLIFVMCRYSYYILNDNHKNKVEFFYDGDRYTAEMFIEMADTYNGTLIGETRQTYVLDMRDKEEYNQGHIIGSINIKPNSCDMRELIDKIPSDYTVYIIGENDLEATAMVSKLKELDGRLFVYMIEGGYEALTKTVGVEKYISMEPGVFGNFTRTKAKEWFDLMVNSSET